MLGQLGNSWVQQQQDSPNLHVLGEHSLHEIWRSEIAHIPGLPSDGGGSK